MFKALNTFLIVFALLTMNVYSSSFLSNRVLEAAATSNQNIEVMPLSDDTFSEINSLKSILANNHFKGKQDSEENDGKASEIVNECFSKVVEGETVLVSCLLTSTMKGKHSNKVIQQNLFFNEKTDYVLDTDQSVLKMSNIASQIIDTEDGNVVSEKKCRANVAFSFVDTKDQKPFDYQSDKLKNLGVEIKVSGGDCDITSTTPILKLDTKYQVSIRVYAYIAFMVMLGLIQAIACGVLVIQIERNANYAKQASLGTLCFLISFDFFIYLQHFTYWTTISNFMIIVFVLFFMIAVFFEPAILYFVFSTLQRRHNISIRTLLLRIYFWVVVSATSVVLCKIYIPDLMLYALPLCLVPQIFDSMYNRQKYRWNFALLAGLMLPKLLYSTVLSLNIFKLFEGGVNASLLVFTATAIILQAIVLKIQTRWPGLGIIKKGAKNLFSYECHKDEIETVSSVICSICTEKVGMNPIIGQQPAQDQEDPQTQPVMKTPCEHYYHESCLKEWFKKKFECPNCRQMLPPLETDDDE